MVTNVLRVRMWVKSCSVDNLVPVYVPLCRFLEVFGGTAAGEIIESMNTSQKWAKLVF